MVEWGDVVPRKVVQYSKKRRSNPKVIAVEERRHLVAEKLLAGQTQKAIAEELSLSAASISLDVKELRCMWAAEATSDFAERLGTELSRLNLLFRECFISFMMSRKDGTHPGNVKLLSECREIVSLKLKAMGALEGDTTNHNTQVIINWADMLSSASLEIDTPAPYEQEITNLKRQRHQHGITLLDTPTQPIEVQSDERRADGPREATDNQVSTDNTTGKSGQGV